MPAITPPGANGADLHAAVRAYWRNRRTLDARPLDALPLTEEPRRMTPGEVAAVAQHALRVQTRRRVLEAGPRVPRRMPTPCSGNAFPLYVDGALRATCRCHWMETAA